MINHLKFWCQQVLPLVYDDSLSFYELLCKIVDKLNEVITSNNSLNEAWQNFINKFDINLSKTVEEILTKWVDDGTFDKIIEGYINNSPKSYVGENNIKKVIGTIHGAVSGKQYWLQGGCYINGLYVACLIEPNSSNDNVIINVYDSSNGSLLRSNTLLLGHANDMTYNSVTGELIVCCLTLNGETTNKLAIIDFSSLELKSYIDVNIASTGIDGIAYNDKLDNYYAKVGNIIYVLNNVFDPLYNVILQNMPDFTNQGIGYNNNYLFISFTNPNTIKIYNTVNFKEVMNYTLPRITFQGLNLIELENISVEKDGTVYMGFVGYLNNYNDKSYVYVTKFNYLKNELFGSRQYALSPSNGISFFIDKNYLYNDSDGSQEKPFKSLLEALFTAGLENSAYTFNINSGEYNEDLLLNGSKKLYIFNGKNENPPVFKSLRAQRCANIRMRYISFKNSSFTYLVNIEECDNITIRNCNYSGTKTENSSIGLLLNQARIRLGTNTFDGLYMCCQSTNSTIEKTDDFTITNCDEAIIQNAQSTMMDSSSQRIDNFNCYGQKQLLLEVSNNTIVNLPSFLYINGFNNFALNVILGGGSERYEIIFSNRQSSTTQYNSIVRAQNSTVYNWFFSVSRTLTGNKITSMSIATTVYNIGINPPEEVTNAPFTIESVKFF